MNCGCTNTHECPIAQELRRNWEAASERFERLPTGGNEYGFGKAFEAYAQHSNPDFKVPPPQCGYGVR